MSQDRIDPRLHQVYKNVSANLIDKVGQELVRRNFVTVNETGEATPQQGLTIEGIKIAGQTLKIGLEFVFQRSSVNIPAGFVIDEVDLTNNITSSQGDPEIEIDNTELIIRFSGHTPLIKGLETPLDPNQTTINSNENPRVKNHLTVANGLSVTPSGISSFDLSGKNKHHL